MLFLKKKYITILVVKLLRGGILAKVVGWILLNRNIKKNLIIWNSILL